MLHKYLIYLILLFGLLFLFANMTGAANTAREGEKFYIVDQRGEKWDVTQAASIGFRPDKFQYGLGRYAFTPLDDSFLKGATGSVSGSNRIIGIEENGEAQAYSIPKLRYHEIANSRIAAKSIVVGY